jgi:hypothetical protein
VIRDPLLPGLLRCASTMLCLCVDFVHVGGRLSCKEQATT